LALQQPTTATRNEEIYEITWVIDSGELVAFGSQPQRGMSHDRIRIEMLGNSH
jgi:hypothetical protein